MGTRRTDMRALCLLAALALTATSAQAQAKIKPQPAFDLRSEGHLKVLTASAWAESQGLSVSGLVRRAPLWKTGVRGHLDVDAFNQAGQKLGSTSVAWRGSLGSGGHNQAARYRADLPGVSAAEVARIVVRYSPVGHSAEAVEAAR